MKRCHARPRGVRLMEHAVLFCCLAATGLFAPEGSAQLLEVPISLEVRGGVVAPLGDWDVPDRNAALSVRAGPLVSGALRVHLPAGLSAYGGYQWGLPECADCGGFGLDDRLWDTGFGFGFGYGLPEVLPLALRFDFGGILHRLTFRGSGQTRPSDHGFGLEAGLTGALELRPALHLEPSLAWRGYSARFEFEDGGTRDVQVRAFAPRLGLRYRFR